MSYSEVTIPVPFQDLVDFIIDEILAISPVRKRHRSNGSKLCATFEEWFGGGR